MLKALVGLLAFVWLGFGGGASLLAQAGVSPSTLNWVSVVVGGKGGQKVVTLTNSGTTAITISSIKFSGANPGDFEIFSKTCGTSLAVSASCTANVLFAPTTTGKLSATLDFTDSASNSPQTMTLTGDGVVAGVTVSPTSLPFASTVVGASSASQTATLSNGGTTAITIDSVAITGADAGDFSIKSNACVTSLAGASKCATTVGFKPTATGARTATLDFTDSATGSPQTVALSGTGAAFSISPLSPTLVVNGTLQFSANASATWTATCGSIGSGSGLYTAPATAESCKVTGTPSGGGSAISTTVTISNSAQVAITPSTIALHAIGTKQFTANQSVTWSTSCGTISSSGLFTAPTTAETCKITATETENKDIQGTATATITVVNYWMRKNGISGNGLQADELELTPANVSLAGNFTEKWTVALDASIWTQPLYLNGVTIKDKARNALYVATSNDSVYALDADTGAELWKTSFLSTGVTAVSGASLGISNPTGILGTPVIDPVKGVLYVVATTSEDNATVFPSRLHALNVLTGAEISGSPVPISNPDLEPRYRFQRPGLLLANGNIYIGFGSVEDRAPYHGLLFAFDENTLEQKAVFNITPTGSEGGLWMSGSTPVADSSGNIYISTANGTADGIHNFGESIVKLSPTLQELDFFTLYNYAADDKLDLDLGSGTVIVVPDQTGPYPHELIACGKPTPIYVLNRDHLGGLSATSDDIIQLLDHQLVSGTGQPCYNSPGLWQQNVYFAPSYGVLKMFTLDPSTGMLSATPTSQGSFTYKYPGADPVISSNGTTNGIVWTIDASTATLHASDATEVSKVLYTSATFGSAVRWVPPTVANGHVYLGLSNKVVCMGVPPTP